jgi:AcrR family transcriptional regulator
MTASTGSAPSLTTRGNLRREELIDAALRLVVREGHHAVSLRSVAQEAEASHGSVAYYFGSRGALMQAAAEKVCRRIADTLSSTAPVLEEAAHDPSRFAEALFDYNVRYMLHDPVTGIGLHELNLAAARDPDLRGTMVKWGRTHAAVVRSAFIKLGSQDPDSDYTFVLSALSGLIVGQLAIPRRSFEQKILRPAIHRLISSVANPPTICKSAK